MRTLSIRALVPVFMILLMALNAVSREYSPLPAELDGSMMPYDFAKVQKADWPDSLRPVYVGYVARHGARFLSSVKKISGLEKHLYEASLEHRLSPEGTAFMELLRDVKTRTDSRWGDLSPVGVDEEIRLASGLSELFPPVRGAARVNALSSFVPRAVMTMYEFCHKLATLNNRIEINTSEGPRFSRLVYCFEADSAYARYREEGDWQTYYDDYLHRNVPTAPARRILGELGADDNELRKLTMDIYGVLQANRAAGLNAPTDRWMTEEEYRACYLAQNLRHYLRNNVTPLSSLCTTATAPLIRRIIADADKSLADTIGNTPAVNGYFGHAETLLPLLSTLRIPGCFTMTDDYERLADNWNLYDIVPLGANFMVILLESPSKNIYASLRLNGRNVPFRNQARNIVPWKEVRTYWQALIPR